MTQDWAACFDRSTIIVGAGIAGLGCARRLFEAHAPFLVIAESVGGRVRRSRDRTLNLGAYYVRADYAHVNRYVRLERRLDRLSTIRHDGEASYTQWDRRLLLHFPEAVRFLGVLMRFRHRYEILKRRCLTVSQAEAIRSDPLLRRLYDQPAGDFIAEHRLDGIGRWYLAPGLHGTAFSSLNRISAFTLLMGALPVLAPAYEFTLRLDALIDGFAGAFVPDAVVGITSCGTGYRVETAGGDAFAAEHVVVATPSHVARRLLGLPAVKGPVSAHMFHVSGTRRDRFGRADINLFAEDNPTLAFVRQPDDTALFCSRSRHPDFDRYFTSWRILEHRHWNPAFHLVGSVLLECEQAPGLFLIGDHNICGLEDAYITGLYAANRIIGHISGARDASRDPESRAGAGGFRVGGGAHGRTARRQSSRVSSPGRVLLPSRRDSAFK